MKFLFLYMFVCVVVGAVIYLLQRRKFDGVDEEKRTDSEIIDDVVADLSARLAEAEEYLSIAIKDKDHLEALCEENDALLDEWRASVAEDVKVEPVVRVRRSLQEMEWMEQHAAEYRKQFDLQEQHVEKLRHDFKKLRGRVAEFRSKKEQILLRMNRSERSVEIRTTVRDFERLLDSLLDQVESIDDSQP